DMDLFGRELVAVDGSKFRAQNSKKNNYNAAKVERHMKYIDKKLEEYFEAADKLDEEEQGEEQAEAWEALSGRVEARAC
ncbi:MAG: IS1182 family transposase, partial [Bacteroidetes bacterium]|nr:IS1182 family transposase [Bacteroidota bacterium]